MSDPLTAIAIGGMLIGGVTAADGAAKQGEAQYQAAMYQSQVAQRNSQIALANSAQATAEGKVAEQQNRQQASSVEGTQRAVQAGLGQLLNTGSAGNIISDTARAAEVDAQTIRYETAKKALGFQLESQDFTSQGKLDVMQGDSAFSAGKTSAFATLLTTTGQVAGSAFQYNKYKTGYKP